MVAWEFRKHFTEAGHVECDAASGNYKSDGDEDKSYSHGFPGSNPLSEYSDSEYYGSYGLESSEDGGGSGAYVLYSAGGAEKRDGCGEDGQSQQIGPQVPFRRDGQFDTGEQADDEQGNTEHQYVEGDSKGSCILESALVYTYNIYGVRKG